MEDCQFFPTVQPRRLKREARPGAESKPVGREVATDEVPPIKMKQEEPSDVPRKVPRFQYVDFPSLHQCIQQLTVPPLNSWVARCPPPQRPASLAPTSAKVGGPKFKYVDFPSLHHCIQQLSVPPLESWTSGLLRPAVISGGTKVMANAVKLDRAGQICCTASDMGTAGDVQDPVLSDMSRHHEQCLSYSCPDTQPLFGSDKKQTQPRSVDKGPAQQEMERADLSQGSFATKPRLTCLASIRTTDQVDTHKGQSPTVNIRSGVQLDKMQLDSMPKIREGPQKELWRTVPESECPFCQKMFEDSEELKVHERSHKDKKPH